MAAIMVARGDFAKSPFRQPISIPALDAAFSLYALPAWKFRKIRNTLPTTLDFQTFDLNKYRKHLFDSIVLIDATLPTLDEPEECLLDAAGQTFAKKGFEGATDWEICKRAGVNIAAVNYYFRDKERLYIETIKQSACGAIENLKLAEWPADTPAAAKLHEPKGRGESAGGGAAGGLVRPR